MHDLKKGRRIIALTVFISFFFIMGRDGWTKNYAPNVHWVFCIDTSGSMKAKGHRDLLKLITDRISHEFIDPKKNIIRIGDRITIFSFDEKTRLEATSIYQTESDLSGIRNKLEEMNKRSGNLTFISEAIVQSMDLIHKYREFFHTSALYVFTDGKSEPYSAKWPKRKVAAVKKKDRKNFEKISRAAKDNGFNVWMGVLKWEAFNDAKTFVGKMGSGGHLVDLTDFNRLPLEKALNDFAGTVRYQIKIQHAQKIDLGTIPYNNKALYQKSMSFKMETEKDDLRPAITGFIQFDPDNPSEIGQAYPIEIKATEDKMVLDFKIPRSSKLLPGKYKGKLKLLPSKLQYGAIAIEPSQFDVEFRKSGFLSFYFWKVMMLGAVGLMFLFFVGNKIRKKMPIKV